MSDNIHIEGVGKVIKRLDSLGDPAIMRAAMNKSVQHLHRRVAKYPPKPGHSIYRRTGTLGRRWTTKVEQGGKRGVVGNNTRYAPYVQGPRRRHFHKAAGWVTIAEVADEESGAVLGYFEDEYNKAIRK
jgi:hypothetical protein